MNEVYGTMIMEDGRFRAWQKWEWEEELTVLNLEHVGLGNTPFS